MGGNLPGSSSIRFPGQEYCSGWPFRPPADLPDPGTEPAPPALAGGVFTPEPPGKPLAFLLLFSLSVVSNTLQPQARQASLSFTISQSWLKLISIESVMPPNHLILCHLLLPPSTFPSIRIFPTESALCIRWPKYWSFSFSISPSSEHSGLASFSLAYLKCAWNAYISEQLGKVI